MKLLTTIFLFLGLFLSIDAFAQSEGINKEAVDCFDSTHFIVKGKKVELDKNCWIEIGKEYNRCQQENELLDTLWHSSDREMEFWQSKYLSQKNLTVAKQEVLDSTYQAFNLASAYLVQEINTNILLQDALHKARRNHIVYALGGGLGASALFVLVGFINNKQ